MPRIVRFMFLVVPLSIFMLSGAGLIWIELKTRPLQPTEYYRNK